MHYQRKRATGVIGPAGPARQRRTCGVADCGRPQHGQGYCSPHYRRFIRHGDPLTTTRTNYGLDFWDRVDRSGDCWLWTGSLNRYGYGQVHAVRYGMGKCALAHRVSWALSRGANPGKECVLHRCDNPRCVRPDHLFLGTRADNTADMITKGRDRFNEDRGPASFTQGERNGQAKLTADRVIALRCRALAGEHYVPLAREFGISESRANAIIIGNGWRHIWPYFEPRSGPRKRQVEDTNTLGNS